MIAELETDYGRVFIPYNDQAQYWWLANIGRSPEHEFIRVVVDALKERRQRYDGRMIAVDVGANFGCWSLALAGVADLVVAYEPQRPVWELLVRTIDESRRACPWLCEITAQCVAVGARRCRVSVPQLDIGVPTNFGGVAVGGPHHEQPDAPLVERLMLPLDDCFEPNDSVAFIKIDVEGGERDVLEGAAKLIARCRPMIFAECGEEDSGRSSGLRAVLEAMSYGVTRYNDNYLGLPL